MGKKNNGQRRKRQGEMEKEKGGEKTETQSVMHCTKSILS